MRIGCLQFAPKVGEVDANLNRADDILDDSEDPDLDLLVLPELAFSGYNFRSLRDISPFLEPTAAGVSSSWARSTALKLDCDVVVGYPETADVSDKWPADPEYYNSALIVNHDGDTWGHYRKSHLYYTDETWALEGSGFFKGHLPGIGKVAMGICMDLNPYKFEAPWTEYEFAAHALQVSANVVILSMAWLTREPATTFLTQPKEPDMETLTYWIKRLEPLIRADSEDEIIVVFANRCGTEDEAVYAGSSAVVGIHKGEVTVYGLLGRGEEELLIVDTDSPPFAKLVYRPEGRDYGDSPGVSDPDADADQSDQPRPDSPALAGTNGQPSHSGNHVSSFNGNSYQTYGHVLVDPESLSPVSTTFSLSTFADPPMSPKYFRDQSSRLGHPIPSRFPQKDLSKVYMDWRASVISRGTLFSSDSVSNFDMVSQADTDPEAEFTRLVKHLHGIEAPRKPAHKAIKTQALPQVQQRIPKTEAIHKLPIQAQEDIPRAVVNEPEARPTPRRRSTKELRSEASTAAAKPPVAVRLREKDTASPGLDQLAIDLMNLKVANDPRNKRDSLLCHVDEDDYIILQTQRRDSSGAGDLDHEDRSGRSESRNTPRAIITDVLNHDDSKHVSPTTRHESHSSSRHGTPMRHQERESRQRDFASPPPPKALSRAVAQQVAHRHSNNDLRGSSTPSKSRPKDIVVDRQDSNLRSGRHSRQESSRHADTHDAIKVLPPRKSHEQQQNVKSPPPKVHTKTPSRSTLRERSNLVSPLHIAGPSNVKSPPPVSRGTESPKRRPDSRKEKYRTDTPKSADMPPTPKAMVLPPIFDFGAYEKQEAFQKALARGNDGSAAQKKTFDIPKQGGLEGGPEITRPRSAVW